MRIPLVIASALAALALCACDRHSDSHLKEAGAEAKAAVTDVGKAIDSSVPAIKDAGHKVGDDIRAAGHKAGDDLKDAGHKVKDDAKGDD
jgi:hypothetical protein